MKNLIIHDTPDEQGRIILQYLMGKAESNDHYHFIDLEKSSMEPCMGCFGCWLKTPGLCVFGDDAREVLKQEINSDRVMYLCPVTWGSYSPSMKIYQDRSLSRVLPFFEKRNGETHHPPRYDKSPVPFLAGYGQVISSDEESLFRKTGDNLNDNIHKSEMNTIIVRDQNDFSMLDKFFEGVLV